MIATTDGDMRTVVGFFNATQKRKDCSWCGATIQPGAEPISHGICPDCLTEHFPAQAAKIKEERANGH